MGPVELVGKGERGGKVAAFCDFSTASDPVRRRFLPANCPQIHWPGWGWIFGWRASSGFAGSLVDGKKQLLPSQIHLVGRRVVRHRRGGSPQGIERDTRSQEGGHVRQAGKLLEGRADPIERIALSRLALLVRDVLGEQTGTMEIDVRIQVVGTPGIDLGGKALRDMRVAQMLRR